MATISPEDMIVARQMTTAMAEVLKLARDRKERPSLISPLWDAFAECQNQNAVEDVAGGGAVITARGRRLLRAYAAFHKTKREPEAE